MVKLCVRVADALDVQERDDHAPRGIHRAEPVWDAKGRFLSSASDVSPSAVIAPGERPVEWSYLPVHARIAHLREEQYKATRLTRAIAAAAGCVAVAVVFRFPPLQFGAFPAAMLIAEFIPPIPILRRLIRVPLLSALAAQLTADFNNPFDWVDRFGFFAAMIGTIVALWAMSFGSDAS